ncbi:MAG: hypothetical protein JWO41_682 [Candidatus Saccharibacteria bacterium]|nr:hypothetical protein [Candidatus Saccharibacteria bacterium]
MIITGITGAIGHGKTTLAQALVTASGQGENFESSDIILEVANALRALPIDHPAPTDLEAINEWLAFLPPILHDITHVNVPESAFVLTKQKLAKDTALYEKLFEYLAFMAHCPNFTRAAITVENKHRYRALLQWLGGYCVLKVHPTIWFDELVRRVQATKGLNLTTIGGVRFPSDAESLRSVDGVIIAVQRPLHGSADSADITERERSQIIPDITVINDGTIEQLQRLASTLYADLVSATPRPTYIASSFSV